MRLKRAKGLNCFAKVSPFRFLTHSNVNEIVAIISRYILRALVLFANVNKIVLNRREPVKHWNRILYRYYTNYICNWICQFFFTRIQLYTRKECINLFNTTWQLLDDGSKPISPTVAPRLLSLFFNWKNNERHDNHRMPKELRFEIYFIYIYMRVCLHVCMYTFKYIHTYTDVPRICT